jgi:hypothetical protein
MPGCIFCLSPFENVVWMIEIINQQGDEWFIAGAVF